MEFILLQLQSFSSGTQEVLIHYIGSNEEGLVRALPKHPEHLDHPVDHPDPLIALNLVVDQKSSLLIAFNGKGLCSFLLRVIN